MSNLIKVINPGTIKCHNRFRRPVDSDIFIKIEIKDGKLSISGVEGPTSGGDADGSCGQISMGYKHRNPEDNDRRYSDPKSPSLHSDWTEDMWLDLLDVWNEWHLNDMNSCCDHQRELGWKRLAGKEVTLYHWRLDQSISSEQKKLEGEILQAARNNSDKPLDDNDRIILNLEYSLVTHTQELDPHLAKFYVKKTPLYNGDGGHEEKKTLGWLYQKDHPDGILCRPCPTCGYKYGSAWLKRDLPSKVIDFLHSLPETKTKPAWV